MFLSHNLWPIKPKKLVEQVRKSNTRSLTINFDILKGPKMDQNFVDQNLVDRTVKSGSPLNRTEIEALKNLV